MILNFSETTIRTILGTICEFIRRRIVGRDTSRSFRVSEINFHAGSMGSSVESLSILSIASSHWNIPGMLLRKVPRNPAGKLSRKLLHPLLCQLHHELPRDVGRGAPRKLAQKQNPSDTSTHFPTRLFTHYSMQRSALRSMRRAAQCSTQLSA